MVNEFTEKAYSYILDLAKERFEFTGFEDIKTEAGSALWRHDVDFSPQRALKLAQLEHAKNIKATYFIQLNSQFYNVFEQNTIDVFAKIADLGHDLGLHFEPQCSADRVMNKLKFEADCLSHCLNRNIYSFSLHNPTTYDLSSFEEIEVNNFINASSPVLREHYTYCSDSNGVWRFKPLVEVLQDKNVTSIYALTHPEWWQQAHMKPRERVQRCLQGRSEAVLREYDELLEKCNRPNI